MGDNSAGLLRSTIDRIEAVEAERKQLAEDVKDIYAEAKSNGLNVKAMREIIRVRKQDADERRAHEEIVETYKSALGMLIGTPLGDAAIERASIERTEVV